MWDEWVYLKVEYCDHVFLFLGPEPIKFILPELCPM